MTGVSIRRARHDDAVEVLALWKAADSTPSVTDSLEALGALLDREQTWLLVAEEGGILVGTPIAAWDGWRGNLYRLAVLPDRRRLGVATALVRAGEECLLGAGARRLCAIVLRENGAGRDFWAAAGYELQSEAGRFTKTAPHPSPP